MRFGIHSGQQHATLDAYLELWRFAEEVGLDWASVFDHFQPIQSDPTGPCFEGVTLLGAMAAHTQRLRLGIIVTGVTYRHPAVLANMATTIDHISHGRLELGVGAAWHEEEHAEYGIPFPRIGVRMEMREPPCRILKALWTDSRANVAGKHFTITNAQCEPKPVQSPIPLWVGGSGEKPPLLIVAEHADGWNTFFGVLGEFRHKLDVLARHCDAVDRDPGTIRKQIVIRAVLDETEAKARERAGDGTFAGTPEQLAAALAGHRELGVEDFLVLARPPADFTTIELFAREVAPLLR